MIMMFTRGYTVIQNHIKQKKKESNRLVFLKTIYYEITLNVSDVTKSYCVTVNIVRNIESRQTDCQRSHWSIVSSTSIGQIIKNLVNSTWFTADEARGCACREIWRANRRRIVIIKIHMKTCTKDKTSAVFTSVTPW